MRQEAQDNIYLRMPLAQVKADAIHGVSAAREALRQRDPAAARAMGLGIEATEQRARIEAGGKGITHKQEVEP